MHVDWLALVISIIALGATAINIYLQYYKVELCPYAENREGLLYLVIENNSSNLAKNYTMKITHMIAPTEIIEQFNKMPLLNGRASFNLSPKKTLEIFVDTHIEAYIEELDKFPIFTIEFFDQHNKSKGEFTVDFSILIENRFTQTNEEKLRDELKTGFNNVASEIKKVVPPQHR